MASNMMTPDPVGSEAWGCSCCWVDLLSIQKNMPPFNIIFEVWDVGPVLYSEELSKWQILCYTIFRHCPANFEGRGARRLKPVGWRFAVDSKSPQKCLLLLLRRSHVINKEFSNDFRMFLCILGTINKLCPKLWHIKNTNVLPNHAFSFGRPVI